MTVELRWEQCCESHGCARPARFGALCTSCFLSATPARRAAEIHGLPRPRAVPDGPEAADGVVDRAGAAWLSELWAA